MLMRFTSSIIILPRSLVPKEYQRTTKDYYQISWTFLRNTQKRLFYATAAVWAQDFLAAGNITSSFLKGSWMSMLSFMAFFLSSTKQCRVPFESRKPRPCTRTTLSRVLNCLQISSSSSSSQEIFDENKNTTSKGNSIFMLTL